jgi:threonine dehydrogenase-like Zn-dependent dehydrogenase
LAGIPSTDRLVLRAATLRRKGLTLKVVRRMKHTYPRALRMLLSGRVYLMPLVTHRFPLCRAAEAFACHAARSGGAIRVVVTPDGDQGAETDLSAELAQDGAGGATEPAPADPRSAG